MTDINSKTYTPQQSYKVDHIAVDDIPEYDPHKDASNPFTNGTVPKDTIGTVAGVATRAVGKGIAGLLDIVAGAPSMSKEDAQSLIDMANKSGDPAAIARANAIVKGTSDPTMLSPTTSVVNKGADAIGLDKPLSKFNQNLDSVISNAAAYVVPIGGEIKLGEMGINAAAGAASGLAQEQARQSGLGEGGQTMLGLAVGASGLLLGHHLAGKFGEPVANVVKDAPVQDVFDQDGHLTSKGQDIAAHAKVDESTLRQAYEEALANTEEHYANIKQTRDEAVAAGLPEDHPSVQAADQLLNHVDDMKAKVDEHLNPPYQSPTEVDNRTPEQKLNDAASLGTKYADKPITLTTGQLDNSAPQLAKEASLAKEDTAVGQQAAGILQGQKDDVSTIAQNLKDAFDDPALDQAQKGAMIQQSLDQLKSQSYGKVRQVYQQLSDIQNAPKVDTKPIFDTAYEVLDKYDNSDPRSNQLWKTLAKYQAIPDEFIEQQTYDPIFKQTKTVLKNGETLKFNGKSQPLTVANAERMNAELNNLYDKNKSNNPHLPIKSALQQGIEDSLESASKLSDTNAATIAKQARSAYQEHMQKYAGKANIIAKLIDKDEAGNYKLNADRVLSTILGTKESVSNLKQLKTMLLSNPETKPLWDYVKGYAVSNIIKASFNKDGISAASLFNQLKNLGNAKREILFTSTENNDLMKLARLAKDISATGKGTSAPLQNHLINMIYHFTRYISLVVGKGASHVAAFGTMAATDTYLNSKLAKEAEETLAAMQDYHTKPSEEKLSKPALSTDRLKQYVDFVSSRQFIQPILQGTLSHKDNQ